MSDTLVSPTLLLAVVLGYFALLIGVSYLTSGRGDSQAFFTAGKSSPWYLVAWGMIGASLSGVTFVSVPGVVGAGGLNQQFSYMQVVLGYLLGYAAIALVLLPLYYRLGLTTIYGYLEGRLGRWSYHTASAFFILSRVIGASFRLYLVAIVLDAFVLGPLGVPFAATVAVTLALIYLYTFRGGIQTVVYTDTLQTLAMLMAVGIAVYSITDALGDGLGEVASVIRGADLGQVFFFEGGWTDDNNFFKQFFGGALLTVVMTGLDQDMMQKNLTCRSLRDAQKNMGSLAVLLVPINALFLALGALLYVYLGQVGLDVPERADQVFPTVALGLLPPLAGVTFVVGLIAAAYSSADSALTSLTTTFCVDFLGFRQNDGADERVRRRTRSLVHVGFAAVLFVVIIVFYLISDDSVINSLFWAANLTYGPLLGLFAFGLFTRRKVRDPLVAPVCVLAPLLSYVIDARSEVWFGGFKFGFLLLALNGLITFAGLLAISSTPKERSVGRGEPTDLDRFAELESA